MQTEYQNLKVSSPAPGHYIIDGLPAGSTQTEEGRLIHPMSVHIPPGLPSGLLLEIIRDRGEPMTATEILAREVVFEEGVKDSDELATVLSVLRADSNGTKRIKDVAEASGVSVERIKELSGEGFEVGAAGWVKLKEGGEA